MSEQEPNKGNSKRILLPLCILLAVVSVASIGLYGYQSMNPVTVTTTQIATSFQTETSISISVWTSISYATVTTAMGTTTALYGSAPCYGGYCWPYESQLNNYCYSANSVGTQCTLYGFVQTASNGCILLSVASGYNNNIYYALSNWQSSYPTFGYVTVNGYISGPSSTCSAIGFYVNSIHQ